MIKTIKTYLSDFVNLIYPDACFACGELLISGEKYLCTKCLYQIPRTNYHLEKDNEVEQIFWGRCEVEHATAFMFFKKKSRYQKLVHKLKYNGHNELGDYLGQLLAIDLKKADWISEIDYLVPVPLHPKREKERGYNQSEWLCIGMNDKLQIPIDKKTLIRNKATKTQTKKNRVERWENVESIFSITDPAEFTNKHVLLIDDVTTTGSTLEACVQALKEVDGIKVSVATIGYAKD
jgi:ComF family protein